MKSNLKRNDKANIENETIKLGINQAKEKHQISIEFLKCLNKRDLKNMKKFLLQFNKSNYVSLNSLLSRTILAIDATYSMSNLYEQLKKTIGTTFEYAFLVLKDAKMSENCFLIQIFIYRNYNVN